jgi:hypothetical protein
MLTRIYECLKNPRIIFPFLALSLLLPSTIAATLASQPAQLEPAAAPQSAPEGTTSTHADDVDFIVLPDGTPLRVKVVTGFSSANAKVGDVIDFVVGFEVRADGIVVIPQSTSLAGKVVSVNRPRRGDRGGHVKIAFEKLSLPTGEAATVRPNLKPPSRSKQMAEAAAEAPGLAAGLFITAGIPLLALPFEKGEEQVIPTGAIEVLYLNGPLHINRKAAMAVQPASDAGFAYVYVGESVMARRKDLSIPVLFCGERVVAASYAGAKLEMSPGTYWFRTNNQKDSPVRIEVLANREYVIWRNRHGLSAREFHAKKNSVYPRQFVEKDLTKLTPEEYRSFTAEPAVKGKD